MTGRFEHFDALLGGSYRLVLAYAEASAAREVRRRLRRSRRHRRSRHRRPIAVDIRADDVLGSRQVQRAGKDAVELRPPKYGSERSIFLEPGLVEVLAAHVAAYCPDGGWIFTGETGQPPHQNTIGYRWRTGTAAAGVTGLRLHDLRHLYASGLIASGCDVVTVQRALGHASATTTLNTYGHLWPYAEDRTRAATDSLMAAALNLPADRRSPVSQ
jgi:integrase